MNIFSAAYSQPGCLPEFLPLDFETFEEAREFIAKQLEAKSDLTGEMDFKDWAEEIRQYQGTFEEVIDGTCYWVTG